eukprot:scaffold6653_cov115-Isochrysis_galbana.AAC.4
MHVSGVPRLLLAGAVALHAPPLRLGSMIRMQAADLGGAALIINGLDVWAGSTPLILDVNWQARIQPAPESRATM